MNITHGRTNFLLKKRFSIFKISLMKAYKRLIVSKPISQQVGYNEANPMMTEIMDTIGTLEFTMIIDRSIVTTLSSENMKLV